MATTDRTRSEGGERPVVAASRAAKAPSLRRAGDRDVLAGPKAERTRAALLDAAQRLFVDQGYSETSVAQIAKAAGVSLGTFYQYFRHRGDVVSALLRSSIASALETPAWNPEEGSDGVRGIIHVFVEWYVEHAPFAKVWEEVCHVDEEVADLRRDLSRLFTEAVERRLLRSARAGTVRAMTPAEADMTARALTGMVDRFCYVTYVFDPPASPPSAAEAASVLAGLWARAVDLAEPSAGDGAAAVES